MGRVVNRTFRSKDDREVTIRCIQPEEAADVLGFLEVVDRTSRHLLTQPGERQMTLEQEREWLAKNLTDAGSLALAAVDGETIVGLLTFKANDKRRIAHHGAFGISVRSEYRGLGIGTELVRVLLEWAAAHPTIEKVCLGVFASNAHGRALYEKMGFKEECRREKEFKIGPGKYVDGIEMSIWVKRV